jgi:hypothetical protein
VAGRQSPVTSRDLIRNALRSSFCCGAVGVRGTESDRVPEVGPAQRRRPGANERRSISVSNHGVRTGEPSDDGSLADEVEE